MKIITLTAMHGRHKTVQECIERMPFIDKVYIYSNDEDGTFLEGQDIFAMAKYRNNPLKHISGTWQFERFNKSISTRSSY
jgi:hypothetical protein